MESLPRQDNRFFDMDREIVSVKWFDLIFAHYNALQPMRDSKRIAISDN
ncbi:hypothetical protein JNB88_05275 [Rhizobium cauense]|nr:hypothetical protein [Rhizobium cauense]